MPFDSTTFAPAKADPLDLDAMIAWLETMPAEGRYPYDNSLPCGCAITQFARWRGHSDAIAGAAELFFDKRRMYGGDFIPLPAGWDDAVRPEPHTYGAALSRFRALRAHDQSEGAS